MTGLEEWKDKERTKKTRKGKSKHPGILKRTTKIITARNNHKATLQKNQKKTFRIRPITKDTENDQSKEIETSVRNNNNKMNN